MTVSPTPAELAALVAVTWEAPSLGEAAHDLAHALGVPLLEPGSMPECRLLLVHTLAGLELRDREAPREHPLRVDWDQGRIVHRLQGKTQGKEAIVKAVGKGNDGRPGVLDATMGLGGDALVLAAHGYRVDGVERSPVVAALLADGLARAATSWPEIKARLTLTVADAVDYMQEALSRGTRHEVVVLDPMYPEQRGSALPRKEMRRLRLVAGGEEDGAALLRAALTYARQRVVVKRPLHAPVLGGRAPHYSLNGGSTRFDIHLVSGGD